MTDLVLEHLKRIQATLADLQRGQQVLQTTSTMTLKMLAELTAGFASQQGSVAELQVRVERIERRLDLHDETSP